MRHAVLRSLTLSCVLAPTAALAHTGHGDTSGFVQGLVHPITGIDHVLAMLAAGMLAAQLGRRALWLLPLSFAVVMAIGSILGMVGVELPFSEIGIAVSVIVLGLAVAFPRKLSALAGAALVGLLGMFHGYAHGTEMPLGASSVAYAVGFLSATGLLIGLGVAFGLLINLSRAGLAHRAVHVGGGAIALCGVAVLAALV